MRGFLTLLFSFFIHFAFAQMTVTGTVTSAQDGLSIIGATVQVKGTTQGAATDIDGKYTLEVPNENAVLVFAYIGMAEQEITVGNRRQIDVVMDESSSVLNEVVVVGYGNQKRSKISGSVSVVTSEEITKTPVLRVEQALQSRTAGVQVAQNSGAPGAALMVRVRGMGTINNSDPIYIVDGMRVDGLDFLNPSDIETINVLKDAASAAIYGASGANGVVLITTKGSAGKRQQGSISYEGYYGIQKAARKIDLLNAREYAIIQNESYINSGLVPRSEFINPDALGEGTDWQDAILQTAPITSHQLTLTNATDISSYSISGSYFLQDGIIGGDRASFERYTARINARHQVKDWLSIGTNFGFTNLNRDALSDNNEFNSPLIRALNMDPVTPVYKSDGTYAYSIYSDTDITNPVNAIEQTYDTWTSNRFVGGAYAEAKILPELTLKSIYSLDATYAQQDIFFPKFDLSNDTLLNDAPAQEQRDINSVAIGNNTWKSNQVTTYLTWDKIISEDHDVNIVVGNEIFSWRHDYDGGSNTNLPSNDPEDAYISNTIDPIASQTTYQGASEFSRLSYFIRGNYEWKNRYLLSGTLRADASSRFGQNNRWGIFPSLSAGWIVSEENFWNAGTVSFLKLRASWGKNGNDAIGNYGFTSIVSAGQNYTFGPNETITNGSVALVPDNADLRWETSTQSDIGVDIEFWEGKLNITSDFYIKETSGMLHAAQVPYTSGVAAPPVQNIGSMRNIGTELALTYRGKAGDLTYSIGGNAAFGRNELTSLGSGTDPIISGRVQSANGNAVRTDVGHPVASFYGYVTDGIFQNQAEIEAHATQNEGTAPGDIRFKDLNNDGIINFEDQDYIGNPVPDLTYGITGDLAYKGLDFSFFIQGVQGNEIYNGTVRYDFNFVNRPSSVLDRWTGEGTSDSEPRVTIADPNQNARISDRFIEDGSFLRLKNVQIGYDLTQHFLKNYNIAKARIYLSGQNLLTFTNYSGMDPEIGVVGNALEIGIDRGFYPQSRTWLGGLQITF